MKQAFRPFLILALATPLGAADDSDAPPATPTYYGDVQTILEQECQVCHRPNGANLGGRVAPMAFTNYLQTRPWARAIARQVESGLMPPWHAAPRHRGVFENERSLTREQKATLIAWARGGAPLGNPAGGPPAKAWEAGDDAWTIGEPDLVIDIGEDYFIEDDVEDRNVAFETVITKEMLPEPRWIKAAEFRPGGHVHHLLAPPLGFILPGNVPIVHEDGFGTLLEPGTTIVWDVHYHKEPGPGTGAWDRSAAALKFYPRGHRPDHAIKIAAMAKFDFEIPPDDPNHVAKTWARFDRDAILLGYTPHMHLRGKSARFLAKYPDGAEEVLLDVPRYDFNWQTQYRYRGSGKRIPAGTEIELTVAWDNSAVNPSNPDPTKTVVYGQPTTSEMMYGLLSYTDATPGYDGSDTILEEFYALLNDRFGVDWESLSKEEQARVFTEYHAERRRESGAGGE